MRGQAFIVFENVEDATKAVQSMQGFPFHSKKMRIQFAKTDSDVIAKRKGTYVPREQSKKKKKKKNKDKTKGKNFMSILQNYLYPVRFWFESNGCNDANDESSNDDANAKNDATIWYADADEYATNAEKHGE